MSRKTLGKIAVSCVALILVLVIMYSGLQILEATVLFKEQTMETGVRKTIIKDGVHYFPRQDINVILMMGIDQEGKVQASAEPNHGNAVDMAALLVIDEKNGNCTMLNINRDTMLEMPMLNEAGREDGTIYAQLAYSHTYGTGVEDSCENTKKAVSNLFYGIHIDYYIAMNLDAVQILNDAVGGVTVNVVDDFSAVDATIPMGTVTLRGDQARQFVQARGGVGDSLNLSRIERQKEYMEKFAAAFRTQVDAGDGFVLETYEAVAPYLVSDLPVSTLTGMLERYQEYPIAQVLSLEGENVLGEQYYEFYPDEEKLDELIVKLFYAPK